MIENFITFNELFAYFKGMILKRKLKNEIETLQVTGGWARLDLVGCSRLCTFSKLAIFFHFWTGSSPTSSGFSLKVSHGSGYRTPAERLWYRTGLHGNDSLFGWPEWVHLGAGQADGGWCLVLGPELEQSIPPEMSEGGGSQRLRRTESWECTEVKIGRESVVFTEGQESWNGKRNVGILVELEWWGQWEGVLGNSHKVRLIVPHLLFWPSAGWLWTRSLKMAGLGEQCVQTSIVPWSAAMALTTWCSFVSSRHLENCGYAFRMLPYNTVL